MWSSYFRCWCPLPPPPHKISNNILIYLTSYRILAPPPPLPVIKIVKYGAVWEGGGGQNPTKDNGAPSLSLTPERPMGHICPMFFSCICYMNITKKTILNSHQFYFR